MASEKQQHSSLSCFGDDASSSGRKRRLRREGGRGGNTILSIVRSVTTTNRVALTPFLLPPLSLPDKSGRTMAAASAEEKNGRPRGETRRAASDRKGEIRERLEEKRGWGGNFGLYWLRGREE